MKSRWLTSRSLAVGVACLTAVVLSVSVAGQTEPSPQPSVTSLPGADAVKALVNTWSAKGFVPPKTPWGDPDLQGIFTTKDEANTPMERPAEWSGRRMEDITPQEFAEAVAKRQQEALETAPFAGGGEPEEGVAIAVPIHWFDNLAAKNSRPWWVIEPADGHFPPLTPAAQALPRRVRRGLTGGDRNTYTDRSIGDRCIAHTWRMPTLYGNSYQILQTPDYVLFRQEQIHEARMIPLDGRPSNDPNIRSYWGDSRGRWDGNTLVVVTTNYHENLDYPRGSGYPAKTLRTIERFTRISPTQVEWSVTIDNPAIWTSPWTYSMPLTADDTQMIFEYACHEGNYGLANLLSAGRAEEKKHEGSASGDHRRPRW